MPLLHSYALALAGFATLLTLSWLFIESRTTFTSGMSFLSWGLLAILGGDIEKIAMDGTRVSAGAPEELRWFLTALSLLSALVFVLYRIGEYPPDDERTADENIEAADKPTYG